MDSRAARAIWAIVVPRVSPVMVPARIGLRAGAPRAGKGRHQRHAAAVGHAFRPVTAAPGRCARWPLRRPSPAHCTTAPPAEDATFQRKLGAGCPPGQPMSQQAVARDLETAARVHEHVETTHCHGCSWPCRRQKQAWPNTLLLVAGHAADLDGAASTSSAVWPKSAQKGRDFGHQARRNIEQGQQIGIPLVTVH